MCSYLVCGVAVPNDEFAILGGTDQEPDERNNNRTSQTVGRFTQTSALMNEHVQPFSVISYFT